MEDPRLFIVGLTEYMSQCLVTTACLAYHEFIFFFFLQELLVSEMCSVDRETCRVPWAATPGMDILSVQNMMNRRGINQVKVGKTANRLNL